MVNPAEIPHIEGNMAELTAYAESIGNSGIAITDTGERVHQTWQGLAAVYVAPESGHLLAATGPVKSVSASVGEDLQTAAEALRVYAADTAEIQARLEALREQAGALVAAYGAAQDEATTIALDERGADLSAAVAAQLAAWETAQLRCANVLRALTGAPLYTAGATLAEYSGGNTVTPVLPPGTRREIFPIDPTPPVGSTSHPPAVLLPGILINVPAPPVTGVVDGPGSAVLPPFGAGGVITDRATSDTPPDEPPSPDEPTAGEPPVTQIGPPTTFDPEELRGQTPEDVRAGIPENWGERPSKSGGGVVFDDPDNRGRQVRIMPGYPPGTRPDPLTWGPYVEVSQNGRTTKVPLAGNPTLEGS